MVLCIGDQVLFNPAIVYFIEVLKNFLIIFKLVHGYTPCICLLQNNEMNQMEALPCETSSNVFWLTMRSIILAAFAMREMSSLCVSNAVSFLRDLSSSFFEEGTFFSFAFSYVCGNR